MTHSFTSVHLNHSIGPVSVRVDHQTTRNDYSYFFLLLSVRKCTINQLSSALQVRYRALLSFSWVGFRRLEDGLL